MTGHAAPLAAPRTAPLAAPLTGLRTAPLAGPRTAPLAGPRTAPLAGFRIVEISARPALPIGGRTLAELGAEVIRIDGGTAGRQTIAGLLATSGPGDGIVLTGPAGQSWLSHAELSRQRADLIHLRVEHRPDTDGSIDVRPRRPVPVNHLLPPWDVAYGLQAAAALLAADRHRRHTGQGHAITLTREDVTHAVAGHLGILAEAQLTRVHQVRIGDYRYGGFARDFATADRRRVVMTIFTRRQFTDLAKVTRLAGTFTFLERLLGADFSDCGDLYTHRESIASMLAPWFARRTMAHLAAAFAGTSVPWTM
jgi:2-methylfumaryl-CoA isomerase